jgi:hypothetical protein
MKLFIEDSFKHSENFCQDKGMFREYSETRGDVTDINCEF